MRTPYLSYNLVETFINLLSGQHLIPYISERWMTGRNEKRIYKCKEEYETGVCPDNFYFNDSRKGGILRSENSQSKAPDRQLSSEVPGQFNLSQNYPNPFSSKTVINFQCPMFCFVSLKVYDLNWKEVITLVFQDLQPGTYQTEFERNLLHEGIYFYRMDTENFTDTKKMFIEKVKNQ